MCGGGLVGDLVVVLSLEIEAVVEVEGRPGSDPEPRRVQVVNAIPDIVGLRIGLFYSVRGGSPHLSIFVVTPFRHIVLWALN